MLELLFPRRCPVCDEVLAFGEGPVHRSCQGKLKYIESPVCLKCGKPILEGEEACCSDCGRRRHVFTAGRAVWVYDSRMRASVAAFKYRGRREYAGFYVDQMAALQGAWLHRIRPEVIMPVPLNWKKRQRRGYNQAELLARGLSARLHCPVDTRYLRRTGWTEPQKSLSALQRYENLKKAFRVCGEKGLYKRVLLVDDIYTTGSTMDACARVLREAGVEEVYMICLCTGSDKAG